MPAPSRSFRVFASPGHQVQRIGCDARKEATVDITWRMVADKLAEELWMYEAHGDDTIEERVVCAMLEKALAYAERRSEALDKYAVQPTQPVLTVE